MMVGNMFSVDELLAEMDGGWVRVQSNADKTLFIYNYSEKSQFAKHWNPVTLNCRGLILDADFNIVARPWKKFFNYGEGRLAIDDVMPVQVTDKMDGSLGILYKTSDIFMPGAIATRGSFNSDQAIHATKVLQEKYWDLEPDPAYTFLFEIIYPKNRIVLNYGDLDDLVLLGAVHNERGYYMGPQEAAGILNWTGPQTETFEYKNMAEAFAAPMRLNAEGLVVRSGTEMVKIKQVDYVALHRLVTGLNDRTVWEQLVAGKSVAEICEPLPDEFHDYVQRVAVALKEQFDKVYEECYNDYTLVRERVGFDCERKAFALVASKSKRAGYLFKLFDGKRVDDAIWQEIKPEAVIDGVCRQQ